MLPMVPIRRKSAMWILGTTTWNFLLCLPFLIAFFILTQDNDNDINNNQFEQSNGRNRDHWMPEDERFATFIPAGINNNAINNNPANTVNNVANVANVANAANAADAANTDDNNEANREAFENQGNEDNERHCFYIPWGYANWARWGFLGLCTYWLATLPFNFHILKQRKQNKESRLTPWLTMTDCLVWVYSFGQWIYAIMALGNRSACEDDKIKRLIWSAVFIPAMIFAIQLLVGLLLLLNAIRKLKKDLESRVGNAKGAVDQIILNDTINRHQNVEVVNVRNNKVNEPTNVATGVNRNAVLA